MTLRLTDRYRSTHSKSWTRSTESRPVSRGLRTSATQFSLCCRLRRPSESRLRHRPRLLATHHDRTTITNVVPATRRSVAMLEEKRRMRLSGRRAVVMLLDGDTERMAQSSWRCQLGGKTLRTKNVSKRLLRVRRQPAGTTKTAGAFRRCVPSFVSLAATLSRGLELPLLQLR